METDSICASAFIISTTTTALHSNLKVFLFFFYIVVILLCGRLILKSVEAFCCTKVTFRGEGSCLNPFILCRGDAIGRSVGKVL